MNRRVIVGLLLVAGVAMALRCPHLDERPMHNDEAVNAIKFGQLWERASYKYDPNEHHGPTLFYATLTVARLTTTLDLEHLTEIKLRLIMVLFGIGMVLLLALIVAGLGLTCLSLFYMTGWTDQTGVPEIVTLSIVQGFGFGLVFVPLSTVAFLTLPNHLRTDGTSMLTLMRNVASSIGISVVIAQLTEGSRRTYAILSQHVNPFNHAMQMPDVRSMIDMSADKGRAMMDAMVNLQAQIIAFSRDYQMVMIFTLCAIPLAMMIGSSKVALRKQSLAPEHAVIE